MVCDAFTTDPFSGTGFIGAVALFQVFFLVTFHYEELSLDENDV